MKTVSEHKKWAGNHIFEVDFICSEFNIQAKDQEGDNQPKFKTNKVKKAKNHIEKFVNEASKNPKVFKMVEAEAKRRGYLDKHPPDYKEKFIYYENRIKPDTSIDSLPSINKVKYMYESFVEENQLKDYQK